MGLEVEGQQKGLHTTQQPEIITETIRALPRIRKILAHSPAHKENEHNRRSDPERAVQVRVPIEHIEEVGARVQCRAAAAQHRGSIDIKELRVEAEGEEVLGRGGRGSGRGEASGGLSAVVGRSEGGVVEGEVFLEVCVAEVALRDEVSISEQ